MPTTHNGYADGFSFRLLMSAIKACNQYFPFYHAFARLYNYRNVNQTRIFLVHVVRRR